MSPTPNYDLGTAHGQIIIDYDNKGTAQASKDFTSLGKDADSLSSHFNGLGSALGDFGRNFGSIAQNAGRNFSVFAGGAGVLGALTLSAKGLGSGLLGLRSGITVLGALRTVIGGVPKSIQGFPNVLKQVVLLSAGISLLGGGLKILENLSSRFTALGRATPVIQAVQEKVGLLGKPVKDIAKLVLTIGTFIAVGKDMITLVTVISKVSAALAALSGAVHIVGSLVGVIIQLSGALLLLPAIGLAAGVVVGTLALGFQNMGTALKSANTPAQLKAQQLALEKLAPAARDFVTQVTAMKPAFKQLQLGVQQQLFEGLGADIRSVGSIYIPILRTGLQNVAGDFNLVGHQTALFLSFPDVAKDWVKVLANIHQAVNNLIPAWDAVLSVLNDVVTVGSGFLPGLADQIGRAASLFAVFIDNARQSGKLAQWIQTGIEAFKMLGAILGQVIEILSKVFSAFNATGAGFLNTIYRVLAVVIEFFNTVQGSQALQSLAQILNSVGKVIAEVLLTALQQLAPIIIALLPFVQQLATDFGGSLVVALKIMGPLLLAVAQGFQILAPVITPFAGSFFALAVVLLSVGAAFRAIWSIVILVTTVIKILQGIIIIFRSVVLSLQVAFWLLDAGMLGTVATIGLFLAIFLVIAVVVGIVALIIIKYWKQISGFLTDVWHAIETVAKSVWGSIAGFFEDIWRSVSSFFIGIWNNISSFFTDVWNGIWSTLTSVFNKIVNFFKSWGPLILAVLVPFIGIPLLIIQHWDQIMAFFRSMGSKIVGFLAALPGIIGHAFQWAFTRGLYYVVQGLEWIIAALIAFPIDAVIYIFKFGEFLGAAMVTGIENLKRIVWNGLIAIVEFFVTLPDRILVWFAVMWTRFSIWWTNLNTSFNLWVGNLILGIINWFQNLPTRVMAWFAVMWTNLSTWWTNLNTSFNLWVGNLILGIVNWFQNLPNRILAWFAVLWTNFSNWWSNTNKSFEIWIGNLILNTINWFKALPGRILTALGDAGKWLYNIGKAILEGLLNGLKAAWNAVTGFIGGIADKIKQLKGPLPYDRQLLVPAGQAIIGGLHSSMIRALPAMLDTVRGIAPKIQAAMGSASATVGLGLAVSTAGATNAATLTAANTAAATGATGASAAVAQMAAASGNVIHIANLNIAGNLDPTNPVAYRQAIKNIRADLRNLDRSGAST